MSLFQERQIELKNGQRINYVQVNQGGEKDIVFIHGNFSSWVWWKDVLQAIQENKNFHVLAVDLRGFGKSTYNNPVIRFTNHAQDIIDFINLKGLKNVTLVGWSYGGGISMKASQLEPYKISKIIPSASISHLGLPFMNQKGQRVYTRQQIYSIPRYKFAEDIRKAKDYEAQKNIYNLVLFPKMPNYPEQKKRQLIESSFIQAQYLDVLTALANPDVNTQNIKAKTLMLHGKDDLVIKLQTVIDTGKLLGNSLQIWQDHGHMLPIQDPKRYVQRISKFINGQ